MKPTPAPSYIHYNNQPSRSRFRADPDEIHKGALLSNHELKRNSLGTFGTLKDLPIHGRAQGGEEGNIGLEDHPIDWTYRPADLQGVHGAFAVFVTGNSMVPKYKNQDLAYIHPHQQPRRGRYALIETINHGGFIKQFDRWEKGTLVVQQFNPAKELRFDREEIRNVMLVIGSLDA